MTVRETLPTPLPTLTRIRRARSEREWAGVVMLLATPANLDTRAFRPGCMNADTLIQYASAQDETLTDWYARVVQLLRDAALARGVGRPTMVLVGQALAAAHLRPSDAVSRTG